MCENCGCLLKKKHKKKTYTQPHVRKLRVSARVPPETGEFSTPNPQPKPAILSLNPQSANLVLNPKSQPQTPSPERETLKPQTPNPKPQTLRPVGGLVPR